MPTPRRLFQLGFLVLILVGVFVVEGNAERWCPFGGVETMYAWFIGGNSLCATGITNLFAFGAILLSLVLLRRAFCSHACPIGTVSEWTNDLARRWGWKPKRVPRGLDAVLSLLKYAGLVVIVWLTWVAAELIFRGFCPAYALLGRHGEDITMWAYVVGGGTVLLSLFVTLPFCRWLCPLAAVMNPISRFGLVRVTRDESSCVSCGKCARACPMGIPVDEAPVVTQARCTACGTCVDACPTHAGQPTLALRTAGRRRRLVPSAVVAGVLLLLFAGAVLGSMLLPIPSFRWSRGELPENATVLELSVGDLNCRGRATMFRYFLTRDDDLEVVGPLRLHAWPAPDRGRVEISYDPDLTDPETIHMALTMPYYDYDIGMMRMSPFGIEGYDPLGLGGD